MQTKNAIMIFTKYILLTCWLIPVSLNASALALESLCKPDQNRTTPINTQTYMHIGGIKQWVTVRGSSCANPVILFVHGGPGNPLSLYSDSLYEDWEKQFTLVHWDQRGSGKTWEANQEPGELTIKRFQDIELTTELIVNDGLTVANHIRELLRKEKLIITGTSWGSAIAVKMISRHPEIFHFYVGVSQLVNYHENSQKSYELALTRATQLNDEKAINTLKAIGPPPWTNSRSFGQLRQIIREYEARVTDPQPALAIAEEYRSDSTRAAYFAGEEFSFVKFVGLKGDGMAQTIALDKEHTEFQIPVYFIQGEEDMLTTPEVTESYFWKIKAPQKRFITVKRAGHDPNLPMLKKQFAVIKKLYKKTATTL